MMKRQIFKCVKCDVEVSTVPGPDKNELCPECDDVMISNNINRINQGIICGRIIEFFIQNGRKCVKVQPRGEPSRESEFLYVEIDGVARERDEDDKISKMFGDDVLIWVNDVDPGDNMLREIFAIEIAPVFCSEVMDMNYI